MLLPLAPSMSAVTTIRNQHAISGAMTGGDCRSPQPHTNSGAVPKLVPERPRTLLRTHCHFTTKDLAEARTDLRRESLEVIELQDRTLVLLAAFGQAIPVA